MGKAIGKEGTNHEYTEEEFTHPKDIIRPRHGDDLHRQCCEPGICGYADADERNDRDGSGNWNECYASTGRANIGPYQYGNRIRHDNRYEYR